MLKGLFNNNPFNMSLVISDIYNTMEIADSVFNFKNFDISSVNDFKDQLPIPKEVKTQMNNITDMKGVIDINGNIKKGKNLG